MSKFEHDLSQGDVVKQLIAFSLPFLLSNIIQSLYGMADMVIVGQFCGVNAMSGVNIGGQITQLLTNLVVGLSAGGTVLIAQYLGYGAKKELKETIGTLFSSLLVLGIVLTAGMVFLRTPLLRLINTPSESFAQAQDYLFITALGTIFIFAYNALSAIMRGMGDSRRPLIFVGIACVANVGLDLLLVGGLGMAAFGAALATVISQALSVVLCILYLRKNDFVFDFQLSSFRFHKERLKMLIKIGLPTSVQNAVTGVSFLFLTSMVNSIIVIASAAVGAVGKFNSFALLPSSAMSTSISAMSAQNIGAGKMDRAVKTLTTGMLISAIIGTLIFALVMLFPAPALRLFCDDPALIDSGIRYLRSFSFDYLLAPVAFTFNGLFIGAGHSTFSLINSMISAVILRVPAAYLLGIYMNLGLFGLGLGAPIATLASACLGLGYFLSGRWKRSTIIQDLQEEQALHPSDAS